MAEDRKQRVEFRIADCGSGIEHGARGTGKYSWQLTAGNGQVGLRGQRSEIGGQMTDDSFSISNFGFGISDCGCGNLRIRELGN
jgi:hypothetical protein